MKKQEYDMCKAKGSIPNIKKRKYSFKYNYPLQMPSKFISNVLFFIRLSTFISLVTNLKFSLISLEITHHTIITSFSLRFSPRFTSRIQVTVKS